MKRGCIFLLLFLSVIGLRQAYLRLTTDEATEKHVRGVLSDIAEEVIAIPLQTPVGVQPITQARNIHKDGNDLFLVSRNTLYHFNREGEFISQITQPGEIQVAGYVVDSRKQEIIVLGNKDDIHYYTYQGVLLKKKKLKSNLSQHQITSALFYQNKIYTTEKKLQKIPGKVQPQLTNSVVAYDTSFRKIEEKPLTEVYTGRKALGPNMRRPVLQVRKDSGELYAYAESPQPDLLLRDSLFIYHQQEKDGEKTQEESVALYPVCLGTRYWIASYENTREPEENYTFCFDHARNESWQLKGGFQDDFYHTGQISRLSPLGIDSSTYTFCQSGKVLEESFPNQAGRASAVVFIVRLKA